MDHIAPFAHTPVDDIRAAHERVVRKFASNTTRPLEYRQKQLRALYWGLKDDEAAVLEAVKLDLGKSAYETYFAEVGWAYNDIIYMSKNLERFMRDEKAEDVGLTNLPMRPTIRKDPVGAVLILGAYNFPLQLSLGPLVGAIAAGCTAVLKPSENSPNSARVMQHVIRKCLDPDAYQIVQGAVPESTALLDRKWDKIFYTGGASVGTIVARKAADTLTPVALELGGRNPAIITKNADLRLAARRLLWAKVLNVGQVCVSQNYVLIDESVVDPFVDELKAASAVFQPSGPSKSSDYGRLVNERTWQRIHDLVASSSGRILHGGESDKSTLFFAPTVILVDSADDPLIQSESFGPLIPILPVSGLDEAIATANAVHATPLGLYAFGAKPETDRILASTRSGGASINDAFFHASIPTLAFGGVGDSGTGAYRGRASFDCFTHRRSFTTTPAWVEGMLDVRYPPFSDAKLGRLKSMLDAKPNFDRQGRTKHGWLWLLLGLGGKSASGATGRWALVVLVLAAATTQWNRAKL